MKQNVRLTRPYSRHVTGEVITLSRANARVMVALGKAEYHGVTAEGTYGTKVITEQTSEAKIPLVEKAEVKPMTTETAPALTPTPPEPEPEPPPANAETEVEAKAETEVEATPAPSTGRGRGRRISAADVTPPVTE